MMVVMMMVLLLMLMVFPIRKQGDILHTILKTITTGGPVGNFKQIKSINRKSAIFSWMMFVSNPHL